MVLLPQQKLTEMWHQPEMWQWQHWNAVSSTMLLALEVGLFKQSPGERLVCNL